MRQRSVDCHAQVSFDPQHCSVHVAQFGNARWNWAFMVSHRTPDEALAGNNNPFGGFPHKLPVGDEFVTHLVFKHEHLRDHDIVDIGIVDVFERRHWVPRKKVRDVVKRVREEFPKAEA